MCSKSRETKAEMTTSPHFELSLAHCAAKADVVVQPVERRCSVRFAVGIDRAFNEDVVSDAMSSEMLQAKGMVLPVPLETLVLWKMKWKWKRNVPCVQADEVETAVESTVEGQYVDRAS